MAQFLLFCFILANAFAVLAVASAKAQTMAPASSPSSNGENLHNAEAPMIRKLGKHQPKAVVNSYGAPDLSPSEAPETKEKRQNMEEPAGTSSVQTDPIEEQGILPRKLQHHHHSVDKSVAGGGVILGGLATTFLVAVFCYIRATGRHKPETVA